MKYKLRIIVIKYELFIWNDKLINKSTIISHTKDNDIQLFLIN